MTNGFDVRLWNVTELLQSIHVFDNFAFTCIYKYMHEKQPFLWMSHLSACISKILILGDRMKELKIRDDSSIISL